MTYYIVEKWYEDTSSYNNPYELIGYKLFDDVDKAQRYIDKQDKEDYISYEIEAVELSVD